MITPVCDGDHIYDNADIRTIEELARCIKVVFSYEDKELDNDDEHFIVLNERIQKFINNKAFCLYTHYDTVINEYIRDYDLIINYDEYVKSELTLFNIVHESVTFSKESIRCVYKNKNIEYLKQIILIINYYNIHKTILYNITRDTIDEYYVQYGADCYSVFSNLSDFHEIKVMSDEEILNINKMSDEEILSLIYNNYICLS